MESTFIIFMLSTPSNELVLIIYTFSIFENKNILTIFLIFLKKGSRYVGIFTEAKERYIYLAKNGKINLLTFHIKLGKIYLE